MAYETLLVERRDAAMVITLNRPQRVNAMNGAMLAELNRAMDAAEAEDAVRAVVLTGAGGNFCSGFDLKEQAEAQPAGVATWRPLLRRDFDAVMRFWDSPKPTLAAVEGAALAGGCELALACDITIAGADALFGEPELRFGAGIVVMLLPWLAGPKRAKQLLLTGDDKLGAARAEAMGLVNEVVARGEALARALVLARDLAAIDVMALRETKRAINRSLDIMGMREALETALDIDLQIEGEGTDAKRQFLAIARSEGLRAAIAWRDAQFGKSTA
jgi:enoyl-CoA hydratase